MTSDPFSGSFGSQGFWKFDPPRPIIPVPATMTDNLRGHRVLIGLPGLGWRGDLRADERVVQGSRTYIPVMPESEWYRAESEKIEVFAALVPMDRVWLEDLGLPSQPDSAASSQPRLVSLDQPPRRPPTPAENAGTISGRRVVRLLEDGGEHRDLRATTELYTNEVGDICARVCVELEWYRWSWSGKVPQTLEVPSTLLWVE